MYSTLNEDVLYESFKLKSGFKVIIYLEKIGDIFFSSNKAFGEYLIEQNFDSENNLISEELKKNPHYTEWTNIKYNDDYD